MKRELKSWKRRVAVGVSALLLLVPLVATAAEVNFTSETILRAYERDTATKQDALILPAYEYLSGRVGSSDEPLSFHLSGWGRLDLTDEGYFQDDTAGELLYGYLEYRPADYNVTLRAGRQYQFEGVANEAFDGVAILAEANNGLLFSLYGGLPVGLSTTAGTNGDTLYGGRVGYHGAMYTIGASYKLSENDSDTAQELFGSDLALYLPGNVSLFGVSRYNVETEDFAEHSYEINVTPGNTRVRAYLERYRYEDYFGAGASAVNPFRFLATRDEVLTVGGADLTIRSDIADLTLKAKGLDYDLADTAFYGSAGVTKRGSGASAYGAELGRLEGDLDTDSYTLARVFAYLEELNDKFPIEFISADLLLAIYDEDIRGEGDAYYVSLGAGKNVMDGKLKLKASAEYSSDPYYTEDMRGSLSATYQFTAP